MNFSIGPEEMEAIAIGGAFLGTGGGGDPYIGKLMAQSMLGGTGRVQVTDAGGVPDDALCVPVCMMGAPTVMVEKLPAGGEVLEALKALEAYLGRKADYLLCIEAGGLNSTIPFAVAAATGLPLVDGDGMGRAFPELQMVSFTLAGAAATPLSIADDKGNSGILNTVSNRWTERLARVATIEMGGAALLAFYPMTGRVMKEGVLRGTLSLIHEIGRTIAAERAANRHPGPALVARLPGSTMMPGGPSRCPSRTSSSVSRRRAARRSPSRLT